MLTMTAFLQIAALPVTAVGAVLSFFIGPPHLSCGRRHFLSKKLGLKEPAFLPVLHFFARNRKKFHISR
jgi:hypothetical protein